MSKQMSTPPSLACKLAFGFNDNYAKVLPNKLMIYHQHVSSALILCATIPKYPRIRDKNPLGEKGSRMERTVSTQGANRHLAEEESKGR